MAILRIVERVGWRRECPSCRKAFLWTKINLMNGVEPYLYCDRSSDVLLRASDGEMVLASAKQNAGREPSLDQLKEIWEQMESTAPPCGCGGRFLSSVRLKCPNCSQQLSQESLDQLIQASWIVVTDGTTCVGDTHESSYTIRVSFKNAQ